MTSPSKNSLTEPEPAPNRPRPPRWQQRQLSPTRGLWVLGLLAVLLLIVPPYMAVIGHLLLEGVILLLEVAEELFDSLLEVIGVGPGAAQMVTAYTGLALLLLLVWFLFRRSRRWGRGLRELLADYRQMYADLLQSGSTDARAWVVTWWDGLGWLSKLGAASLLIFVVLPLLTALVAGLGVLLSYLIF